MTYVSSGGRGKGLLGTDRSLPRMADKWKSQHDCHCGTNSAWTQALQYVHCCIAVARRGWVGWCVSVGSSVGLLVGERAGSSLCVVYVFCCYSSLTHMVLLPLTRRWSAAIEQDTHLYTAGIRYFVVPRYCCSTRWVSGSVGGCVNGFVGGSVGGWVGSYVVDFALSLLLWVLTTSFIGSLKKKFSLGPPYLSRSGIVRRTTCLWVVA